MDHFYKSLSKKEQTFIDDLFDTKVLITEKLDGQAFSIEKNKDGWTFFKRNAKEPINAYDRTLNHMYEGLIEFFESKSKSILNKIPDGYRFEMEYIKKLKPNLITYDTLPKNNLVLHSISIYKNGKLNSKIEDIDEINKFAKLLNVDSIPIIFQGYLNSTQKQQIINFLKCPNEDLIERFKVESFTQFIFSILDPQQTKTYLQKDLSKAIEGIVFYFNEKTFLAKLVDPTFEQSIKDKKLDQKETEEGGSTRLIILEDFSNFLQSVNLSDFIEPDSIQEKSYVNTIGNLFIEFINKNKNINKYKNIIDEQPAFTKEPEMTLNYKFLSKKVAKFINKNELTEIVFKQCLMYFRITRKRFNGYSPQDTEIIKKLATLITNGKIIESSFLKFQSFSNFIFENTQIGPGSIPCNLIIGKFQPFTNGHFRMVDQLYKLNKYPTFIISVRRKEPILSEDITTKMFNLLIKNDKRIAGFGFIDRGLLGFAINKCRQSNFEPYIIGCGSDRVSDYTKQISYIESKQIVPANQVEVVETFRTDDDISATKVRTAICDDDVAYIKKSLPSYFSSIIKDFKKELTSE